MENEQTVAVVSSKEIDKGVTIKDLWYLLRKHLIAILIFLVVGTAGGFAYDRFQPVQYKSSATLMGNKGQTTSASGGTYQDYYLADYVSQTLVDFVTQHRVLEDTISYLCNDPEDILFPGKGYGKDFVTISQLESGVKAESKSLFVTVTFSLPVKNINDPKFQKNSEGVIEYHMIVLDALCHTIVNIANETKKNDKGVEVARYPFFNGNIDIMSSATNTVKVGQATKRMLIGLLIGALVALVYIVFRQLLDNRFKDAADAEHILGLPVLASIPEYSLSNFPEVNKFDPRENAKLSK